MFKMPYQLVEYCSTTSHLALLKFANTEHWKALATHGIYWKWVNLVFTSLLHKIFMKIIVIVGWIAITHYVHEIDRTTFCLTFFRIIAS